VINVSREGRVKVTYGLGQRLTTYVQLVACTTMLCACGVTRDPRPANVGSGRKPTACVSDEAHPRYKQRTLRVGQRQFKVRLERCVPDATARAILRAYSDDQVMDHRTKRTSLRPFSEERIDVILEAGSWRLYPEDGFAQSEYAVRLASPWGTLHMQFVSVEGEKVMLWTEVSGET
jgi:hypothetical protein